MPDWDWDEQKERCQERCTTCQERCTTAKECYCAAITCGGEPEMGCKMVSMFFVMWFMFLFLTVVGGMCMALEWYDPQYVLCHGFSMDFNVTFTIGLLFLIPLSLFCLPMMCTIVLPVWADVRGVTRMRANSLGSTSRQASSLLSWGSPC